jgi:hypothetical protein
MNYKLSNQEPLASGSEKLIFQHPDSPNLLIKVWHQAFFDRTKQRHPITTRFRRLPRFCALTNEITEHLAVREQNTNPTYIQHIVGLVDTDIGPGLVVEAITQKDGLLAQTLRQTIETKTYGPAHEKALNNLLDWVSETNIILRDLGINNLVWDEHQERFVVIDGIGSKPSISLRTLSREYNKYSNAKRSRKLRTRVTRGIQMQKPA